MKRRMMKTMRNNRWKLIFALPFALVLSFGFLDKTEDNYFEISKNLDIFGKMYREVNAYYVDDVDPAKFMRTGIDAMLESLDPYTSFISASEIEEYKFMSTGQYGGIGAVISTRDKNILVAEPYEGSPSAKAGLKAGDMILKIDNEVIEGKGMNTLDVRNLLRGQPSTKVNITVRREGVADPILVEVTRDDIKIKNVPYFGMVDAETGYISLTGFTQGAGHEVASALETLKRENPGIKAVILDLRGNPGGLLFESVEISNVFVAQGEKIVETRGRMEGSGNTYGARNQPVDTEIKMAVLVNRRSASASEIVSGVMQDLDRAVVLGQRSFGKGLVQTTRTLSYNSQLKITTAKYYTPSGRCIQALDYSNRNEDGSVGKVADSLMKPFKTSTGRTVYDGGGINPDFVLEVKEYHTVTSELIRQNIIFDFATQFASKHDKIASPREFEISNDIYDDFVKFAESKNFVFDTPTDKEITKLKEQAEKEKYLDEIENDLKAMEAKMIAEKKTDIRNFREEISLFLENEILNRYYFRSGEIQNSFDHDKEILEATKVLKDDVLYKKTLNKN
jgi:carboxyl-terminal processing protease